jgi:hypothetical protein
MRRTTVRYRWDPAYPTGGRRATTYTDTHLRASDAERNEVADKLARHFGEGRLDQVEFKARLDRAMGATTRGDLTGLFDDLPRLPTEPPPRPPRHRRLIPFMVIVLLVVVAAGATLPIVPLHVPWLLIVVVGLLLWRRAGRHHDHSTRFELDR